MQQHPAKLIGAICLTEAILTWSTLVESPKIRSHTFLCGFKLHYLLHWTLPGIDVDTAFFILCFGQELTFQYLQLACMLLNACLCHDLMKTLSNPFEVAKSRLMTYFVVSFSIPVILLSIIWTIAVKVGGQTYPSMFYEKLFIHDFLNDNVEEPDLGSA